MCPLFHKLLAGTWQLMFSPSRCYLHALLNHLSPFIDFCQICFLESVSKDQALHGAAALQNCTSLKTLPGCSSNFCISRRENEHSHDSRASTGFPVKVSLSRDTQRGT